MRTVWLSAARAAFGRVAGGRREHVVELRDRQRRIADHRDSSGRSPGSPRCPWPSRDVLVDGIDAEADDLDVALVEVRLELGHVAELGGADRGEVLRVREDDAPGIAEPLDGSGYGPRWCRPRSRAPYRQGEVSCSCPPDFRVLKNWAEIPHLFSAAGKQQFASGGRLANSVFRKPDTV